MACLLAAPKNGLCEEGELLTMERAVELALERNLLLRASALEIDIAEGDTSSDPLTVPEGHIFTLGDNRPVSLDSRHYGPVSLERVSGRAVFVAAPWARLGLIDGSSYTE